MRARPLHTQCINGLILPATPGRGHPHYVTHSFLVFWAIVCWPPGTMQTREMKKQPQSQRLTIGLSQFRRNSRRRLSKITRWRCIAKMQPSIHDSQTNAASIIGSDIHITFGWLKNIRHVSNQYSTEGARNFSRKKMLSLAKIQLNSTDVIICCSGDAGNLKLCMFRLRIHILLFEECDIGNGTLGQ